MNVERFVADAVSQGFVITNKAEVNHNLEAGIILVHPELKCLLPVTGELDDEIIPSFLYIAYPKDTDLNELNKIDNSFFYEDPKSKKRFGFLTCQDDIFERLSMIRSLNATPTSIPTDPNVVSIVTIWGEKDPMTIPQNVIDHTLKDKTGRFFNELFDTKADSLSLQHHARKTPSMVL
ncbi:MAG: hypothetical protein HAW67_02540 [Endozoicomonadaceae bacterium]|nr:hypothetical protein [Endozoicomonadaceae bacterium]